MNILSRICIIVLTACCSNIMTSLQLSENIHHIRNGHEISHSEFFETVTMVSKYAARRYCIPTIKLLYNVKNAPGSLARETDHIIKEHVVNRNKSTAPWYIAKQLGPYNAGSPYIHNIIERLYPTPLNCRQPLDNNNQIVQEDIKNIIGKPQDTPQHNVLRDILSDPNYSPLYRYFNTGFRLHTALENTPESFNDQQTRKIFSIYNHNQADNVLKNWATTRYHFSTGTNPQFQKELLAIAQSSHPVIEYITHNVQQGI